MIDDPIQHVMRAIGVTMYAADSELNKLKYIKPNPTRAYPHFTPARLKKSLNVHLTCCGSLTHPLSFHMRLTSPMCGHVRDNPLFSPKKWRGFTMYIDLLV